MCEINPKYKDKFVIEFFTTHEDEADFYRQVYDCLLELEQKFNANGKIRVHVHEFKEKEKD